jgi:hypothetical protein
MMAADRRLASAATFKVGARGGGLRPVALVRAPLRGDERDDGHRMVVSIGGCTIVVRVASGLSRKRWWRSGASVRVVGR